MAKTAPIPRPSLPLPETRLTSAHLLSTTVVLEQFSFCYALLGSVKVLFFLGEKPRQVLLLRRTSEGELL